MLKQSTSYCHSAGFFYLSIIFSSWHLPELGDSIDSRGRTNKNAEARRRDISMVSLPSKSISQPCGYKRCQQPHGPFHPPVVVANNTTRLSWFHPRKSFSPARTNHRTSKSKHQQHKGTNTFHDDILWSAQYTRIDNYNIEGITKTTTARVGSTSIALIPDCLSLQLLWTAKRPPWPSINCHGQRWSSKPATG
jgi:hypothetical protein